MLASLQELDVATLMPENMRFRVAEAFENKGFEAWQDLVCASSNVLESEGPDLHHWGARVVAAADAQSQRERSRNARGQKRSCVGTTEFRTASSAVALCTIASKASASSCQQNMPEG